MGSARGGGGSGVLSESIADDIQVTLSGFPRLRFSVSILLLGLSQVTQLSLSSCCIKEIAVFCPCETLRGLVQWVDAPGCNDSEVLKMRVCESIVPVYAVTVICVTMIWSD
jgi:hypothetical protein